MWDFDFVWKTECSYVKDFQGVCPYAVNIGFLLPKNGFSFSNILALRNIVAFPSLLHRSLVCLTFGTLNYKSITRFAFDS